MTTYLLTGAGGGVGVALASAVARPGVCLALVDSSDSAALRQLATECVAAGAVVSVHISDVRDRPVMTQVIDEVAQQTGRLDYVFANAGIINPPDRDGLDVDCARELMETNFLGALNTLEPASAILRRQGSGGLVSITSIGALVSTHNSAAYSASKAALRMWTDSLRLRMRGSGVSVTDIVLGFVDTPMTRGLSHARRLVISPDAAATSILKATHSGAGVVSIPRLQNLPWWGLRAAPTPLRNAALGRAFSHFNGEET